MRIPNPTDLRPAGLEPARGIAQISEGVAGRIGQAGRQMGNAIESIGAAFGDVAQRQAATEDATNLARAKLDWYKFDNEAWTGLQNSVKEDGSGWERTPEIYDKGRQDIVARYPISDPRRREELNLYLEHQIAKRGFDAARQKQTQAGSYYRSIEDKEIDGAVARIEANPSQASVDAFRGPLGELVESGRGIYHSEATIEKRKREIEGKLLMGQYRGLIKQDPEAAAELFKRIQEGQYEIDAPRQQGAAGTIDLSNGGQLRYDKSVPASIRHNNPGATYPAPWMKEYGMNGVDIIGGGHKIANFPDAVSGAAANIDLMHRDYAGMPLSEAIRKWSGNNSPEAYTAAVSKALGISPNTVLTKEIIASDGWKILKAQSEFESGGRKFELSDEQWRDAQGMFREKRGLADTATAETGSGEKTRYAGLKPSTASDAVVIGETPAKGQDGAANDNPADAEGIQGLISEIRGVAKEAPHLPLSEVLDRETLTALADQFPEVASIEDFDNATVSDALKAMEGGDKQGKTLPPRADNMSPMGRLAGGQVFTVKSKVGDISVTAESLNALDRNMLKKLQSEAKEMSLIRQREGEAIAEDLVRKQLLTLENTGKNHSEFDPKLLAEVYRRNPKKIAEYERRAAIATQVHEATADATNLPNDILEARLDNLRTSIVDGAGDADPTAQAAFDRAEKRVKNLISIRERDPARAVRDSREVAEVRAQIPDGEPKNKAHLFQMADATIKAQTRLGIPVVPITKSEARTIMSDIIYAPENQKRAVAQETAKKINETYGSLAPQIMSAAIKLTSGDTRDDDDMLGSAMKRLQRQSTIKDVDNAVGATGGKKQDRVPSAPNYFDKFDKVK